MPGSDPSSVVVFDFDGTLVNRDSLFDFSVRYCLKRPARLLLMLALLPVSLLALLRSTEAALSALFWSMTLGTSVRSLARELRSYARNVLPAFANEAIFAELVRHVHVGDRVLVATGSLPSLVRELMLARHLRPLSTVGSRLRRKWGGLVLETHCTGRTKLSELERRFDITRWAAVYTNSFADAPLMRGTPSITLVGASRSTVLRTQQLIGPTTELRVMPAS